MTGIVPSEPAADPTAMTELAAYCEDLGRKARAAARELATAKGERKNLWLTQTAAALEKRTEEILAANAYFRST